MCPFQPRGRAHRDARDARDAWGARGARRRCASHRAGSAWRLVSMGCALPRVGGGNEKTSHAFKRRWQLEQGRPRGAEIDRRRIDDFDDQVWQDASLGAVGADTTPIIVKAIGPRRGPKAFSRPERRARQRCWTPAWTPVWTPGWMPGTEPEMQLPARIGAAKYITPVESVGII